MSEGNSRKLEVLLERRRKVEGLTVNEKIKWKKEIDKLDMEINEIKIKLGMIEWNEDKAINILREANLHLTLTLRWTGYDKGFNEFLRENPELLKITKNVDRVVDEAFYKKDMEKVKEAVQSYYGTYERMNKIWRDSAVKDGFRTVLEGEEGYLRNPWGEEALAYNI